MAFGLERRLQLWLVLHNVSCSLIEPFFLDLLVCLAVACTLSYSQEISAVTVALVIIQQPTVHNALQCYSVRQCFCLLLS